VLIESVMSVYYGNASGKGLALSRFIDDRISPAVVVDSMRLRQILSNLVGNAIKFTSEGYVELRAALVERRDGDDVIRFSVTDTGIGISEDAQKELFQPFKQAHAETAQRFGGTGLGLSICQRLTTLMGGTIGVLSEPGRGTTMILTLQLPVADPELAQLARPAEEPVPALDNALPDRAVPASTAQVETGKPLILLVDDHPVNRMILLRQVNNLGYPAEAAEDGAKALEKWRSGRFALVVTDCNMPVMNGYELARAIRSVEAAERRVRTPIIACTANALQGEAENCLAAGMDDYLAKPIELGKLAQKLERWVAGAVGESPIDNAVLAEISSGDEALARDILIRFRRYNAEDTTLLTDAVRNEDFERVTHASHRIKGASKTVGATSLATVCELLERAGRAKDWPAVKSHIDAFHREVARVSEYIESFGG
jgi:CheY-like chemotaxis protein/anti-sigma regulatory factor (Ser/Thr protein kinase)